MRGSLHHYTPHSLHCRISVSSDRRHFQVHPYARNTVGMCGVSPACLALGRPYPVLLRASFCSAQSRARHNLHCSLVGLHPSRAVLLADPPPPPLSTCALSCGSGWPSCVTLLPGTQCLGPWPRRVATWHWRTGDPRLGRASSCLPLKQLPPLSDAMLVSLFWYLALSLQRVSCVSCSRIERLRYCLSHSALCSHCYDARMGENMCIRNKEGVGRGRGGYEYGL